MEFTVVQLLGVAITTAPESDILTEVERAVNEKRSLFITTPNPEIIVEAGNNQNFTTALSHADVALPDGTGVVVALKMKGVPVARIRGREFFEKLLQLANTHKWRVFLLGGSLESNRESRERILNTYPSIVLHQEDGEDKNLTLDIHGNAIKDDKKREHKIIQDIQTFSPHLLFVAFGHPKQELWADRVRSNFPGTTIMTVGGTFDSFSGRIPSPSKTISAVGLEWLFRLIIQPQRWKRIFTALVIFPINVLVSEIRRDK